MSFHAWHQCFPHCFPVFPRWAPVAYFPALGTSCIFSRALHWLDLFPRLAPVAYFPALGTSCIFSRALHRLQFFLRLAPVAYFPALDTGWIFSVRTVTHVADMFRACHRLVFLFPLAHPNVSVWTSKWHSFGFKFLAII